MTARNHARRRGYPLYFFVGFGVVALLIAGLLSYLADPDPDGLDSATLRGCRLDHHGGPAGGSCIAQHAQEHALANSPFADYAVGGDTGLTGVAGVVGVLLTLLIACGLFWLLRRRRGPSRTDAE